MADTRTKTKTSARKNGLQLFQSEFKAACESICDITCTSINSDEWLQDANMRFNPIFLPKYNANLLAVAYALERAQENHLSPEAILRKVFGRGLSTPAIKKLLLDLAKYRIALTNREPPL